MSDLLNDFLQGLSKPATRAKVDNFLQSYGLSQNPFPPNRTIVPEIIYGQDRCVKQFLSTTAEILNSKEPQRRALAVVAGTGGGKTHFLSYCNFAFPQVSSKFGQKFVQSSFIAGSGKMIDLLRNILRDADEFCKKSDGCDFLTALVGELSFSKERQKYVETIAIPEVRECIKKLLEGYSSSSQLNSKFDLLLGNARKWINAETLSPAEKRQLGVLSRISTPAIAVKVIRELFSLARKLNVFHGLFLSIDEIESLFTRGLSPAQIQAFLQDIRYFYDESVRDNQGFDLLLVTASTTTGASNLIRFNQPMYQRFGYEKDVVLLLSQIDSVGAAIEFAHRYIDYYASKWKDENPKSTRPNPAHNIITAKEIEAAFNSASSGTGRVAPGALLDILHKVIQDKRGASNIQPAT